MTDHLVAVYSLEKDETAIFISLDYIKRLPFMEDTEIIILGEKLGISWGLYKENHSVWGVVNYIKETDSSFDSQDYKTMIVKGNKLETIKRVKSVLNLNVSSLYNNQQPKFNSL